MNIPEVLRALDAQIVQLQRVRQLLSNSASTPVPSFEPPKRRGRPPGPAKAREVKPAGKRTMSEEGKVRIVAAQKKRWAKSKRAAKDAAQAPMAKTVIATAKKASVKQSKAPAKKAPLAKSPAPVKKSVSAKKAGTAGKARPASAAKRAAVPKKVSVPKQEERLTPPMIPEESSQAVAPADTEA